MPEVGAEIDSSIRKYSKDSFRFLGVDPSEF